MSTDDTPTYAGDAIGETGETKGAGTDAAAQPRPSPSLLFLLFADRFIPPGHILTRLTVVGKDKDVTVDKVTYAGTVLAAAFWNLRRAGYVTLEPTSSTVLGVFRHKGEGVRRAGAPYPGGSGLEGAIMAHLADAPAERQVADVVHDILGRDSSDPWADVLHLPEEEAIATGCMERVEEEHKGFLGIERHATGPRVDAARVAALEGLFEETRARWDDFRRAEPELYHDLLAQCERGIVSRLAQHHAHR